MWSLLKLGITYISNTWRHCSVCKRVRQAIADFYGSSQSITLSAFNW